MNIMTSSDQIVVYSKASADINFLKAKYVVYVYVVYFLLGKESTFSMFVSQNPAFTP
jgi:hypothetical protein